ncbi:Transmembrane protein 248 [Liparis tanakae]|uniref:Transmembrane protein 248 n=1 Tax=Liparis tanakae TaxID=230148 RepID=A0A4Z2FKV5_9TELE|nr:Transmembrane protein 248 [Liparis tanakae]
MAGQWLSMQVYLLNPVENLRSYINTRPPLVIFMVSVSAVAIAFLTIGYFFKIKEIKSPEFTETRDRTDDDWRDQRETGQRGFHSSVSGELERI